MSLPKITQVAGRAVYVPGDDIDTDRIIPARFMRCVSFEGLGQYAFYDERFAPDGSAKEHPLNNPLYAGASILITGSNFGCGSSREHAPQALYRHGFRAILAESFAEIFFGNATTLGIPCMVLAAADLRSLVALLESDPQIEVICDVTESKVTAADVDFPAALPSHAKESLISGRWDAIADLLEGIPAVHETASRLAYFR